MHRLVSAISVFLVLLFVAHAAFADAAPWRRRRRRGTRVNHQAAERVAPEDWPAEPESPTQIDPARFASAYHELCGWMPPERDRRYGDWILEYAAEFEVDPFLVAAMSFRFGRCRATAEGMDGVGLTLIPRDMYSEFLRRGRYTYWVRRSGEWHEQHLEVDRFPFAGPRLRRPEEGFYFTAAILRVWREQHQSVDEAFEQVPHRHYVSHFVWGDRVRSDRAEDRILVDRRRMLQYYGSISLPDPVTYRGLEFGSPLDGAPRVVSSYIGDERDGGSRNHRGIDVESVLGEPVRAVAEGRVNFAGVDLPGRRSHENLEHDALMAVPRSELGNGGRFVCILHRGASSASSSEADAGVADGPDAGDAGPVSTWVRTCYMHLEEVNVTWGQEVQRGEVIGTVGRTGMQRSSPHLHFEVHAPDGLQDGSEVIAAHLLGRRPEPPARRGRRR